MGEASAADANVTGRLDLVIYKKLFNLDFRIGCEMLIRSRYLYFMVKGNRKMKLLSLKVFQEELDLLGGIFCKDMSLVGRYLLYVCINLQLIAEACLSVIMSVLLLCIVG